MLAAKYRVLKTDADFNNELGLSLTVFRLREEDEMAVLEMGIDDFGQMHRLRRSHARRPRHYRYRLVPSGKSEDARRYFTGEDRDL